MSSHPPQAHVHLPKQPSASTSATPSPTLATGSNTPNNGRASLSTHSKPAGSTPNASGPTSMSAAIGGAPPNHNHSDSVNGRNQTIPAIPSVNGSVSLPDHTRKPSMTVTPAGATGFSANGAAAGAPNKPNIQFGSVAAGASAAMGTPPPMVNQGPSSLSVNQLNPRATSPSNSPSPIPQPAVVSGGRPPSTYQGQGNGYTFGQMPGDPNDQSAMNRPVPPMQFGAQQEHIRRGSSQSVHSDVGGPGLPTGPNRGGYPPQGGRGRGYPGQYNQPMTFSPQQPNFRPAPNGRGMQPGFQGRGQQMQYQGSPSMATRSPAMMNATPGTPNMGQINMVPGMHGQPNGGYYMGPHNVKKHPFPRDHSRDQEQPAREGGRSGKSSTRVIARRGNRSRPFGRGGREHGPPTFSRDPASDNFRPDLVVVAPVPKLVSLPDLSPESGNFEHFLTQTQQAYQGIPTAADPSIQVMYQQNQWMQGQQYQQGQYPPYMHPQSPRPQFQGGYQMQPNYSNQGAHPVSMSRQSSQMSVPERPGSSIGQQPHTPSVPTPAPTHSTARTPSISGVPQNPGYKIPAKKSAAITIKNASGEVVSFSKPPASPAAATPSIPAAPPASIPTPPLRTDSAADNAHTRTDSNVKTDDERKKAMQEAVAKKIAEDEARAKAEKEKAEQDQEAAQTAEREATEAKAKAEALEKDAREAEVRKLAEQKSNLDKAQKVEEEDDDDDDDEDDDDDDEEEEEEEVEKKATPAPAAAEDEIDFDAIEAEMAAMEAEEARREEEYKKKKAAALETQRKKEEEDAAAYEANMKEAERKAEEEELAREKEREQGSGDETSKKLFSELKANPFGTPASAEGQTPAESGTATPVSDTSMGPPSKAPAGRRGKATELTLDTKKPVEPPEPSATLKALQTARRLDDLSKVTYPSDIASPSPALNANAPADRKFKYNKEFLLQFQAIFKEKPSLDWDARIRDALGDGDSSARPTASARTPSGMGNRNPSRGPAAIGNFGGPMGSFAGRPSLPPGSTSEQRFAASNAAMRGGPIGANPFAQFGRPGQMGTPMGRTPSNNPLGPIPGSPRVSGASRGGSRAESKRNKHSAKQAAEENKSMPLTAGMNIGTLETSATGWKPKSLGQGANVGPVVGGDGLMEPDVVQRKVKAALNKMTPEKFDKIADQILEIAAQSKHESDGRTLRQVIQLTFEKATDEAHWAPMYAAFCRRMLESMSPDIKDENIKDKNGAIVTGGNLFRKYLLNRCQEEFERGWKVNLPPRPEGTTEEAAILSDEYYIAAAAKRRGLGLVRFIGELFKLSMLTERIMHECVKKLVDYEGTPDEAEVESLTSLLKTIGKQLDSSESKAQGRMDLYFERINQIIAIPDLPSRLKFMLMDIVDLRRKGWQSKDDDKGPKTIQEIHAEAQRKAQEDELKRIASQGGGRGSGGGRMPMGRGDARSFSYGQPPPPDTSNRVGTDDLRRLNRSTRNASNTGSGSLGPPSMLAGRTNSGRRGLGPGGLLRGDDSNASSRTGTPPAQKDKDKKDESSTNAFSALAALENEAPGSPPSNPASPPTQKSQPSIERERSRSPEKTT